jgi:hypothetical protein
VAYVGGGLGFAVRQVKTRASFAMPFYTTKLAILSPRQARDKHRENSPTKETDAFFPTARRSCNAEIPSALRQLGGHRR